MRYPAKQKAETHEKILAAASRSFREHGSDSNGIGQVMKQLGLTKGGFYRHFESKGDLYAAAIARAFEEMGDRLIAVAKAAPEGQELRAIIESYLSVEHLNAPGSGCALAALAPEIARQPMAVRKRIFQTILAYGARLFPYLPGSNVEEKRGQFFVLSTGMAGALVTARAIPEQQARERMLALARSFYLKSFAAEAGS